MAMGARGRGPIAGSPSLTISVNLGPGYCVPFLKQTFEYVRRHDHQS